MGNEKLSTGMALTFPCVLIGQSTSPGTNLSALGIILRYASHLN